jgi:hypothetical protein
MWMANSIDGLPQILDLTTFDVFDSGLLRKDSKSIVNQKGFTLTYQDQTSFAGCPRPIGKRSGDCETIG